MFRICKHQLQRTLISPKTYIALFIGCVIQIINTTPLLEFSQLSGKPLGLLESFIYFNCDTFSASATFLGILLLVSDIPFSSESETYTLIRISRLKWVLGKTLYLFSVCLFYYVVIAVAGMLYISENAYMANFWSEPIYLLAKDSNMNFAADYNVYFPYNYVLSGLTPLKAFASSYILSVLYAFVMSMFVFWLNLKLSFVLSYVSAIILHIIGYLIAAAKLLFYMRLSLLGNSLLMYHDIGDYDRVEVFLSVTQSLMIYLIISLMLIVFVLIGIKKYDFRITIGTKS